MVDFDVRLAILCLIRPIMGYVLHNLIHNDHTIAQNVDNELYYSTQVKAMSDYTLRLLFNIHRKTRPQSLMNQPLLLPVDIGIS